MWFSLKNFQSCIVNIKTLYYVKGFTYNEIKYLIEVWTYEFYFIYVNISKQLFLIYINPYEYIFNWIFPH